MDSARCEPGDVRAPKTKGPIPKKQVLQLSAEPRRPLVSWSSPSQDLRRGVACRVHWSLPDNQLLATMPFSRSILLSWILVPLMALGSLRGTLCWCDHDHNAAGGHGEAGAMSEMEHSSEGARDEQRAGHGHGDPQEIASEQHMDTSCCEDEAPGDDCLCVDLKGVADFPVGPSATCELQPLALIPVALPPAPVFFRQPSGAALPRAISRLGRPPAAPLFLVNCSYLC